MDTCLSILGYEAPEKRVLKWLEHCSAAPKDVAPYASSDTISEIDGSGLNTEIHLGNDVIELSVPHSISKQKNSSATLIEHLKIRRKKASESDSGCLSSSTAWRLYTHGENEKIIRYIVENDAFPFLKGTLLWQKMEKDKICYRSWQSMKAQFITKIYPNIGEYSLEDKDKRQFIEYMKPTKQKKFIHMEPGQRGWRKNGKYYTVEEDLVMLKYILHRCRHLKVHGNSLWQTMEDKEILPGRTWQSMRSRYLNVIRHSLDEYKLKVSDIEILMKSKKNDTKSTKQQHMKVPPPLSPCTNITNIVSRKLVNQNIRKYAICTGSQLASKLKLQEKKSENVRNSNKDTQPTNHSSEHHEASEIRTSAIEDYNNCEKNAKNNNDVNKKNSECSNACKVPSIATNSQIHEFASADMSTSINDHPSTPHDNALQMLCENDMTIENSGSGNNLQEYAVISDVTRNKTLETERVTKGDSSSGNSANSYEDRNNAECALSSLVSNLQECVESVNQKHDGVKILTSLEKPSIAEVNFVKDVETYSEISDCEGSLCSQVTLLVNSAKDSVAHLEIGNCIKCSSDHKLSPSSN